MPDTSRCSCGTCRTCTPRILAALKAEAQPPAQRTGIGAVARPKLSR